MSKTTYKGKDVIVLRKAEEGDQGFEAALGEQVVIQSPNGITQVVKKSEVGVK